MGNKCKNCGFEYDDLDVFCSQCGQKIEKEENYQYQDEFSDQNDNQNEEVVEQTSAQEILRDKSISIDELKTAFLFTNPNRVDDITIKPRNSNNAVANFIVFLIIVAFLVSMVLLIVLNKHSEKKSIIEYKNMMSNPSTIPELKEPSTIKEMRENFVSVEKFMSSYLSYAKDSPEKKQQVFISFLAEIQKLPHITNESLIFDDLNTCKTITDVKMAKKCSKIFTDELHPAGIMARSELNTIYFYPDYEYLDKIYSPFFAHSVGYYLLFKSKYPEPVTVGVTFNIKPMDLANKIADNEYLVNNIEDKELRDLLEKELYNDFRSFIFSPSIYATTTQEMKKEFKKAYNHFIKNKKASALRPVILSYMDKQKAYSEENFANDYPYRKFEDDSIATVEQTAFSQIFTQVRKTMISKLSAIEFSFIYNLQTAQWYKFNKQYQPKANDYIISSIDDDNNLNVYNNVYTFIQEIPIPKHAQLFYLDNGLYLFEKDSLDISKFVFDGKEFKPQRLSQSELSSVFPGVEVINIDNFQSYNILVEKDNKVASYIIVSKYSKNYDDFVLSPLKGDFYQLTLPNMFKVDSLEDAEIAFHDKNVEPDSISENSPVYKFILHTKGQKYTSLNNEGISAYDEKTANDENVEQQHKANIMPKIESTEIEKTDEELLNNQPPSQVLDEPNDDE
ncbi:MAG: zinc ribbon domain-containing protein [Candidatus Gastranaerophilales bacterium]|nr:zinc ribbon domain-containing protein [Candidatus Gastranaerophilales bacterium]